MPTQKEKLETLTGEKFPEPTPQELKRIQIENTPFWIIGNDEKGYNITFGKYKLNNELLNFKEELLENNTTPLNQYEIIQIANAWIEEHKYNIICSIIIAITTDIINNQNKQ